MQLSLQKHLFTSFPDQSPTNLMAFDIISRDDAETQMFHQSTHAASNHTQILFQNNHAVITRSSNRNLWNGCYHSVPFIEKQLTSWFISGFVAFCDLQPFINMNHIIGDIPVFSRSVSDRKSLCGDGCIS